MRFTFLVGLSIAPLALGCMAAARSEPPPHGPVTTTTVTVPKDSAPAPDGENKKPEGIVKQEKLPQDPAPDTLADDIGESFGEGGLGLAGTGKGGGGLGVGGIGTLGHGAGTGSGQGFGSGSGSSGSKARVAAATATTSGSGLAPEIIRRIVRQGIPQIQACYEKAMMKSPTLAGKVAVKFVIDAKGAVTTASAADTNITDADMVSCVVAAVKRMAFPAPDGGGAVVVTYPFNFASAEN